MKGTVISTILISNKIIGCGVTHESLTRIGYSKFRFAQILYPTLGKGVTVKVVFLGVESVFCAEANCLVLRCGGPTTMAIHVAAGEGVSLAGRFSPFPFFLSFDV